MFTNNNKDKQVFILGCVFSRKRVKLTLDELFSIFKSKHFFKSVHIRMNNLKHKNTKLLESKIKRKNAIQ